MTAKNIFKTYKQSTTASDMIFRIARRLRYRLSQFFMQNDIDLTPEQWRLLLQLAENNGQTQSELADPVLNDRPNITRIIDGMEKRKLLVRSRNPDDRRSTRVYLSQRGKELINTWLPDVLDEKSKFFDGLDETDIAELIRILSVVEKKIDQ